MLYAIAVGQIKIIFGGIDAYDNKMLSYRRDRAAGCPTSKQCREDD